MTARRPDQQAGAGYAASEESEVQAAPRGIHDAAWISASLLVARLLGFLTTIVAARVLTVGDLASYLVAVSATVVVIPAADAGLWQVTTRLASRNPNLQMLGLTARAAVLRGPIWVGLTAVAFAIGETTQISTVAALAVVLASVGQVNLDAMCGERFARQQFRAGATLRVVPAVLALIGTSIMVVGISSADAAIVIFAAARLLPVVVGVAWTRPRVIRHKDMSLQAGLPFAAATGAMAAYTRSDLIMLQAFKAPASAVAQYGIAYNLVIAMQLIPSALATALFPRIAGGGQRDREKRELALAVSVVGAVAACLVAAAAIAAVSPLLSLFDSALAVRASRVAPLFLTLVPVTISQIGVSALQGLDFESHTLKLIAVGGIVNVGANLALIPLMGIQGALIGTLTAETLIAFGTVYLLTKGALSVPAYIAALWLACVTVVSVGGLSGALTVASLVGLAVFALTTNLFGCYSLTGRVLRTAEPR